MWMELIKISLYLTDLLTVVPVPNVTRILFLVSEVKSAERWTEELPCMQSLSVVFVKGAWCPWYWIRVWRHIRRRRSCCYFCAVVCAEEHPDSLLHVFVCIKHCKADRIVTLCTFHPNILRCVSRAAARIDALTVIWVSVSLDCSLTSFDICETSVRFIGYLDSCKVWPNENINARSV